MQGVVQQFLVIRCVVVVAALTMNQEIGLTATA
ncbi:fe-S domain protein, partial [Acinetobacter baumannii 135867]